MVLGGVASSPGTGYRSVAKVAFKIKGGVVGQTRPRKRYTQAEPWSEQIKRLPPRQDPLPHTTREDAGGSQPAKDSERAAFQFDGVLLTPRNLESVTLEGRIQCDVKHESGETWTSIPSPEGLRHDGRVASLLPGTFSAKPGPLLAGHYEVSWKGKRHGGIAPLEEFDAYGFDIRPESPLTWANFAWRPSHEGGQDQESSMPLPGVLLRLESVHGEEQCIFGCEVTDPSGRLFISDQSRNVLLGSTPEAALETLGKRREARVLFPREFDEDLHASALEDGVYTVKWFAQASLGKTPVQGDEFEIRSGELGR